MGIPVTAVFDIGKTNKKIFLFNENFREIYRDYRQFGSTRDENGYPTDDIVAIQQWLKSISNELLLSKKYDVKAINFSTYGASLAHIDSNGKLLTPLYNYTKPYPEKLLNAFYKKYGNPNDLAMETGSPSGGMLNSGLQLFWLKYEKPEIYDKIKYSIHFPQYLSYLFTHIPLSEYTSIGCHTSLWDYKKNDYHEWVYNEELHKKLPPIVTADTLIDMSYHGKSLKIGVGIHDSSSALLPYLRSDPRPFILISTGTWSISFNPFNKEPLTPADIESNSLNYMQVNGMAVRATRLFLGNEYKRQTEKLCSFFGKKFGYHHTIKFSNEIYKKLIKSFSLKFHFESLNRREDPAVSADFRIFQDFEEAFHQLMLELVHLQVKSVKQCIGNSTIEKIYIDGGFIDNDIFVKLMGLHFKDFDIKTSKSPLGSALGAAMVLSKKGSGNSSLENDQTLKKHWPLILI